MFSPARSAQIAAIINASTRSGGRAISIRMCAQKHYVQCSLHVKITVFKSDVDVKAVKNSRIAATEQAIHTTFAAKGD